MVTGLEILGAISAGVSIADKIWSLCSQALEKPNDTKSLAILKAEAQSLSVQLQFHELNVKGGVLEAYQNLRKKLDGVVADVSKLKGRPFIAKAGTALKLYRPEFRERVEDAKNEFQVRMWLESCKSADEMDGKLNTMTNMMEHLKVTAESVASSTDTNAGESQETMAKLTKEIETLQRSVDQLREAIAKQESCLTARIPNLESRIHETIHQAKTTILEHIDQRVAQNDSLTRIKAELLSNPSSLTWYDRTRPPTSQLWTLDTGFNPDEVPCAEYEGIALSSTRLDEGTIEDVYGKRHLTDDVDERIRERRHQRSDTVSPYFALTKRGQYFEELSEYMPAHIQERFQALPSDLRREVLHVSQRFGQESRYAIIDDILRQKSLTLTKIHLSEDMERAMLACNTGKLRVKLGFYVPHVIDDVTYLYKLQIFITSAGYRISLDEYPCRYKLNPVEQAAYDNERLKLKDAITETIYSAGRQGRGELLRMSVAVFTHLYGNKEPQRVRGDDGIEYFFDSLFDVSVSSLTAYRPIQESHPEVHELCNWHPLDEYRQAGGFFWSECIMSAPDSEVRYSGPSLLSRNYYDSAAYARLQFGDIEGAMELCSQPTIDDLSSDSRMRDNWEFIILDGSELRNNYDIATRVFESVIAQNPQSENGWQCMLEVYERRGELSAGVERLIEAHENGQLVSFFAVSDVYLHLGDIPKALDALQPAITVDYLNASRYWEEIGQIHADAADYDSAIHAFETFINLRKTTPRFISYLQLVRLYRAVGRIKDAIAQFHDALKMDPDEIPFEHIDIFTELKNIYTENGNYDDIIKILENTLGQYPDKIQLRLLLGNVYEEQGDYDAVIELYETAIDGGLPGEDQFWKQIGRLRADEGDAGGATEAYEMVVSANPGNKEGWDFLVNWYIQIGYHNCAEDARRRAQERLLD